MTIGGILQGLILLFCGGYLLLLARGFLPRNPREPEKMELWRRKFGRWITILAPIMMVGGILHLLGLLP